MIGSFPIGSVPYGSNEIADGLAKQIVTTLLAQANGVAFDFNIGVETTLTTASGQAYDATSKLSVEALFAQANTESYNAITSPVLGSGLSSAEAYDFSPVTLYADDVVAVAVAYDIIPKSYLQTLTASASAQAYGMELGLDADDVVATTQVYGFNLRLQSSTATSSSQAYDIASKVVLSLGIAEASAQAYGISQVDLETDEVVAIAQAYNITPTYVVRGVPDIVVTRSSGLTSNEIKVLNSSVGNVNIYRASDHRGLFSRIATNQSSPYTDSGLSASLNYKYRATFVVNGNIGGSPVEQEGQKSEPRYTIGNRTL